MKKTLILLTLLAASVLCASPSQQLIRIFKHINTLSGQFTQTVYDGSGQPIATSKGTFAVQRPNKFSWNATSPLRQLTIADGKTVWLYQPDLKQVTKTAMTDKIGQTPLAILSGSTAALQNNFVISSSKANQFMLKAKAQGASFKEIILFVKSNAPTAMTLFDSLGQKTELKFTDVQVNHALKKHPFQFSVPKGVDVVSA